MAHRPSKSHFKPRDSSSHSPPRRDQTPRPPLTPQVTTLWEYPSQHYDSWLGPDGELHKTKARREGASDPRFAMQGDKAYVGATPSWVIWNLLVRYTKPGDTVLDPMCGSGTTLDVCTDLDRLGMGCDLNPQREEIRLADARELPVKDRAIDFVFIDPPYSTHVDYSDDPRCIGKLDASPSADDHGEAYFAAMSRVIQQIHRVLKPGAHMALYVSDSWRRTQRAKKDVFMPIGFQLFSILSEYLEPVDIISVVRNNEKLERGNFRKAAEESNFFLRGFNYLFILKKT